MRWLPAAALAVLSVPAQADETPICTDRPTKANAVCTVSAGKVQLESSLADWTVTKADGMSSELLLIGGTVAKLGLSDHSDLQVGFVPYARLSVRAGGETSHNSGIGDVVVRYKHRLTSEGRPVQLGLIPFVKLPTASKGLGNDRLEGGLAVPVSFSLTGPVTMTLGPEIDLLADADGHGRHLALVNLVNLSAAIMPRLTIAGELWTNVNFDPADTVTQASVDAAIAYAASYNLQLDLGSNFGLNRDTPDIQIYAGASVQF